MTTRICVTLIFLFVTLVAWHGVTVQVRRGRTTYIGGDRRGIPRERCPVTFWCHIVWDALAGLAFAAVAVLAAIGYFA